jgi:tetratricopeptide (TPR) repeat protein
VGSASDAAELSHLRDQALQEGEAGKTAEAIRDYQKVLAQQPDWLEGRWNLGMLQYQNSQFAEAQANFARVAAAAPDSGITRALLGLTQFETKNYAEALASLQKAKSLGIKDDEEIVRVADYHLALLLVHEGEFDRASELLRASFGAGNVPPQARVALGLATLRAAVLPSQLDPSREALVSSVGEAAITGDVTQFADLVQQHPDLPWLHMAYAQSLEKAGKTREAIAQYSAETRNSPASREPHEALSVAYMALGDSAEAQKERQLATALPTALPNPDPHISELYAVRDQAGLPENQARWDQARREYATESYVAASADLKSWLAANPSNGTAWALLGLCEFSLKDYGNALIHLDRSANLGMSASAESIDQARLAYGSLLTRAGRFDEAETVLATAWHPNDPLKQKVETALGLALLRRTELPDDVAPASADLVNTAGRIAVLVEQSKYNEAFPELKQLLNRYPGTPFLHYAYGTVLIALSEFDQASAEMQAERALSPQSELPCLRLASIALRKRDPAPAIEWAHCALKLAPGSVDGHYLLGRASLETGDIATAIKELELASSLSPQSPEIHFNLAKAYARAKLPEKAQKERETFSRLNEAQKANPQQSSPQ